jgi:Fe2+ transport system protein FeoA
VPGVQVGLSSVKGIYGNIYSLLILGIKKAPQMRGKVDEMTLLRTKDKIVTILRIDDADAKNKLTRFGIISGESIKVKSSFSSIVIEYNNQEIAIGKRLADKIFLV